MKNKKLLLLAAIIPFALNASYAETNSSSSKIEQSNSAAASSIASRVNEIRNLDASSMTKSEKKAIRAELLTMQTEAKSPGVGIYISGATLILIIILLILFL